MDDLYSLFAGTIFALLGLLLLVGTGIDFWKHHTIFSEPTYDARSFKARSIRSGSIVSTTSTVSGSNINGNYGTTTEMEMMKIQEQLPQNSRPVQFLLCFSVIRNFSESFSAELCQTDLKAIHGLKCITIFALVWMNVVQEAELKRNPAVSEKNLMRFTAGFVTTSLLFTISATLNTYKYMEIKYESRFNYFTYLLGRLWRLLPIYVIVLLFVGGVVNWLPGDYSDTSDMIESCKSDSWQNVLFVNNFFRDSLQSGSCLPQTWFVAANFQLWVLTPIVWHSFFKFPKITIAVLATISILQIIVLMAVSATTTAFYVFDYYAYQSYYNFPSWSFGLISGFLLCNQRVPGIGRKTQSAFWCFAILSIIAGPTIVLLNVTENQIAIEILIVTTPIAVAWLVAYVASGYGGLISQSLSHPFWRAFSRSSYCTLITHWVFIKWFGAPASEHFGYEILHAGFFSIGCVFWGTVISVCLETPFYQIPKIKKSIADSS